MIKFKCTSCGACCRRAGLLGLMPQREDGACINLDDNNQCMIYETRPDVCRVDVMAEINRHEMNMSTVDYFKLSNTICNQWIKEDRMENSYLINIGDYDES